MSNVIYQTVSSSRRLSFNFVNGAYWQFKAIKKALGFKSDSDLARQGFKCLEVTIATEPRQGDRITIWNKRTKDVDSYEFGLTPEVERSILDKLKIFWHILFSTNKLWDFREEAFQGVETMRTYLRCKNRAEVLNQGLITVYQTLKINPRKGDEIEIINERTKLSQTYIF